MSQGAIPFGANSLGINVTATTGALTAVLLPSASGTEATVAQGDSLLFFNEGPNNAWIALGGSSVAATLPTSGNGARTCTPVPAGAIITYTRSPGNDLYISTITRTGTANINVLVGEGS